MKGSISVLTNSINVPLTHYPFTIVLAIHLFKPNPEYIPLNIYYLRNTDGQSGLQHLHLLKGRG